VRTVLVIYDLNRPEKDYKTLLAALEKYGNYFHCLDSTWILRTTLSATDVMAQLRVLIDANDELLVLDVTGDPATWIGFNKQCWDWLANNMK
jgi:hypothetical protein